MRIGHGYDVHRFSAGRALILGGVTVPYERGLMGHSDADVLTHAIMDALLGAACLGDIGRWFPDTDETYAGASSLKLLAAVMEQLRAQDYHVVNVDATILAQRPKLAGFIPEMRKTLALTMEISVEDINIKATTEEGLGFTGREEGIAAHAVCLLEKNHS